jgi:hypothetical protein
MAEQLTKLRPDRDLQCYFQTPSAVAALSQTSANGFTVSGCWRQASDWAVVEWNRDNVFEHPTLRNLPDGDLSGVRLSYEEVRTGCIPLDSTLKPTVEWPYLRIWATGADGEENIYFVPLESYATTQGESTPATCCFQLQGTMTQGDYIELAWLEQHFYFQMWGSDNAAHALSMLASAINGGQATGQVSATATGDQIELTYLGLPGANGNRIGVYGIVSGAATESWSPEWAMFSGGTSPEKWAIKLDFSALEGYQFPDLTTLVPVPTTNVRKMRWTWAADMQMGDFQRTEFSVAVTNWNVTGTNLTYNVAGPGSRRIEDDAAVYQGSWNPGSGNFSGGSIHWTTTPAASVQCSYTAEAAHSLYLGTRLADTGAPITVQVDGNAPVPVNLALDDDDVLVRVPLGQWGAGAHTVTATHAGSAGECLYFDFLEIAIPTTELPAAGTEWNTSLATDWDTEHSQALAPERTAWLIDTLGFGARENHYAGALWFYELSRPGHQYASATITFAGTPQFGDTAQVSLDQTAIQHVCLIGDTAESVATCFALLINAGSNAVWAQAQGAVLTITSRTMGTDGNGFAIGVSTVSSGLTAQASGTALEGGGDRAISTSRMNALGTAGYWTTDLEAMPRLNRAARDWSTGFFTALQGYGMEATAAFSMELQNGDDSTEAGIAQRYPDGSAAWLNTPSLQTNFSPASTTFWQQVFLDMAGLMASAGMTPYLQFGETQWWYSPNAAGMPYYDAYTTGAFQAAYGRAMATITSPDADTGPLVEECSFLAGLIGQFTETVMDFVRASYADARFEVLYPVDVNEGTVNLLVNFPSATWTPDNLACLKTENFTYTEDRDLDKARQSIALPGQKGFPPAQASHLVGISDPTTPWQKERRLALAAGMESVVLFALDQFCLVGYGLPLERGMRTARFVGK